MAMRSTEDVSGRDHEYFSSKTYEHNIGLSCCFRQWRAESHCKYMHGYALKVKLSFVGQQLDERNWLIDFGSFSGIKAMLQDLLDHKTLVAEDDPELDTFKALERVGVAQILLLPSTGCEAIARIIFESTELWLGGKLPDVELESVEVSEHPGNSAGYRRKPIA